MNMTAIEKLMEQNNALKAELEKAQACAAEMRSFISSLCDLRADPNRWPETYWAGVCGRADRILGLNDCGVGWLSPEKVKELNNEIGNLRERATHAEQAALEMAEKVDELKAENQLMRESLQRIATNPSSIASQHIARETLDKLKGQ